jgi:serine protease Do
MKISIIISLIFLLFGSSLFSQKTPTLENFQAEISHLINCAKHSVVTVSAKSTHSYTIDKDNGLLSLFKNNHEKKQDNFWTVGSGIIYNQDGYIITRSSILEDFEEIKVTLCDGSNYEAEYVGTYDSTGLAVLKIEGKSLEPTRIGNSDQLALYSLVMVIGNSMGVSPFPSFGLVNGYTEDGRLILSASINPGNIGGAVFNLNGEIIGIVSAQVEAEISLIGPNYRDYSQQHSIAIPINQVASMVNNVIKLHHQQIKWLGIELDADSLHENKLIVTRVYDGSPAARVGLKKGDLLVKYNEADLSSPEILRRQIGRTEPGTSVSINFIRYGRALKVFPRIERIWPDGFTPNKPRHFAYKLINENIKKPIQSPMMITPARFQQINSKMIQMENEIRSLKNQINK